MGSSAGTPAASRRNAVDEQRPQAEGGRIRKVLVVVAKPAMNLQRDVELATLVGGFEDQAVTQGFAADAY